MPSEKDLELLRISAKIISPHGIETVFWLIHHPEYLELLNKPYMSYKEYSKMCISLINDKFYELAVVLIFQYQKR